MPFLGKTPKQVELSSFGTRVKDDFTANGSTTAFTLSKSVSNPNDIAVFVGNVRQEPTDAYTVNGTTLTMSDAPTTGLNFYVVHTAGTIESSVVPSDGTITSAKLSSAVNTSIAAKLPLSGGTMTGNLVVSAASPNVDVSDTGTSHASQDFLTNSNAARTTIGVERAAGGGLFVGSSAHAAVFGSAGANSTQIASNNTVRMTVDTAGKVGVGTTSPVTNLDVMTENSNTRARIRSNTNSSPSAGLELCRGITSTFGADAYTDFLIENINGGHLSISTGESGTTTERLRLDSSGNLYIGRTSSGSTGNGHTIRGGDSAIFSRDATGETVQVCRRNDQGDLIQFRRNGSICGEIVNTGGSSVAYNTLSDYRLKENIVDLTGASARVNQLDVKRFNFISDGTDTVVDGFLAHEVADVVPEAVTGTKDAMRDEEYEVTPAVLDDDGNVTTEAVMGTRSVPKYQGIDQSKLVPLLTAALQEALSEIASLKTRVQSLEDE